MEDPSERKLCVQLGVAWAKVATMMEGLATNADSPNPIEETTGED